MRKTLLAAAVSMVSMAPALSFAEDSPHTLTANVGLYSQYIFRGLTQTNEEVALQGGFDYSHASGLYLGVWGSNVSWLTDSGQYQKGSSLEIDVYGGLKKGFGDFTVDVGLLQYLYPGDVSTTLPGEKGDTLEGYIGLGWKWFNVKYSNVLSNKAFAVRDARGTDYWDFSASLPVGETGLTLGAHYGIQKFHGTDSRNPVFTGTTTIASNDDVYSYDDWRVSAAYDLGKVSKTLSGAELGVMYTDTSSASICGFGGQNEICPINGAAGAYPKNIAQDQVTVWFKKTF